jgi:hypothetical protein
VEVIEHGLRAELVHHERVLLGQRAEIARPHGLHTATTAVDGRHDGVLGAGVLGAGGLERLHGANTDVSFAVQTT